MKTNKKTGRRPDISIILPIWNEERGIEEVLTNLAGVFGKHGAGYEIDAVYQTSKDNTLKILEKICKKNRRVRLHKLIKNGYALAINYGLEHAKGRYIGYSNSDGEVSAEDSYRIYKILKEGGYDAAKACRIKRKQGIYRTITTKVFNFLICLRFNLGTKDINGWPFFFKRELYKEIRTDECGEMYDLDMKGKLVGAGHKLAEVEVLHQQRKGGESCMKFSKVAYMQWELIRFFSKNHGWNKKGKVDYFSIRNNGVID